MRRSRPRGRHKSPVPPESGLTTSFPSLLFDAIRAPLSDLRNSIDILSPLDSTADAVLAVWDSADSFSPSDEYAIELACGAFSILSAMHRDLNRVAPVPSFVLDIIRSFRLLLRQISAAMEKELEMRRLGNPPLQGCESPLAQYVSQLEAISEAYKLLSVTPVEEQTTAQGSNYHATRSQTVTFIRDVFGGKGGSGGNGGTQGGSGGAGNGPFFQAQTQTVFIQASGREMVEQIICLITEKMRGLVTENMRGLVAEFLLFATEERVPGTDKREVRVLQIVVLFGLSPVSRGYPSGCAGAL